MASQVHLGSARSQMLLRQQARLLIASQLVKFACQDAELQTADIVVLCRGAYSLPAAHVQTTLSFA